jgi:hypothetical protein
VLNVMPVPVIVGNKNLVYIDVEKGIVFRQNLTVLFLMVEFEWRLCKIVDKNLYVLYDSRNTHSSLAICLSRV